MLLDVQRYLATHERTTLGQLAIHFHVAPPAIQGMLARLVAKGKVRRLPAPPRCRGCATCDEALLESYEWIGEMREAGA